MKTHLYPGRKTAGSSILAVMLVIMVSAVLVGSVLTVTQSNSRMSYRSRQMTSASYAAEALLERAYLVWQKEMAKSSKGRASNQQLKAAIVLADLAPKAAENDKLATFTYPASVNGVANLLIEALAADGTPITTADGLPTALTTTDQGTPTVVYRYRIVAFATAQIPGKAPITMGIERTFTRRDDSLSVGVFLQNSAGIHPGDKLIFDPECQIHSNGTLYAAAYANTSNAYNSYLQFQGPVTYVNGYTEGFPPGEVASSTTPKAPVWNDGQTYANSTTRPSQLKATTMLKPDGIDQETQVSTTNPNTTNGYREIIEIPTPGTDPYATARVYNQADVIILLNQDAAAGANGPVSVSITGNGGSPLPQAAVEGIQAALRAPATGTLDRTEIYDRREKANVTVTSLHLDKLGDAIAKYLPTFNGVLYVADVSTPQTGKQSAVRLVDGARLPGSENGAASVGFTIASQNAVYIQGDYNTDARSSGGAYDPNALPANRSTSGEPEMSKGAHIPAAIMADAVTLLSNSWNDSRSTQYEPSDRTAASTTVEASIVAGVTLVKTPTDQYIEGGAHNIVRLLEDWTNKTLTLNGSLTQLYESKNFTGTWSVYPIYYPGTRRVMYDSTLKQRRPPGQPPISTFMRGEWRRL